MYTQQAAASRAEIFTISYGNTCWMLKLLKDSTTYSHGGSFIQTLLRACCVKLMEVEYMNEYMRRGESGIVTIGERP